MKEQQQHEMVLEKSHPTGAEEWYCPVCGRRMAIIWQPWNKTILEPGDVYASHSACKGGLRSRPLQSTQDNENSLSAATEPVDGDPYLTPWLRWLDKIDSDDFWNREF